MTIRIVTVCRARASDQDEEAVHKDVESLQRPILQGTQALVPVESNLNLHDKRHVDEQDRRD